MRKSATLVESVIKQLINEITFGDPDMMRFNDRSTRSNALSSRSKDFPTSSRSTDSPFTMTQSEKKFDLIKKISSYIESEMGEMVRGERDTWIFYLSPRYGGKRMLPKIVSRVEKMIQQAGDPSVTVDYDMDSSEIILKTID